MPDFAEGFHSIHSADIEHVGRVWLRDGTSDPYVFNQIFQTEEFNISTAPQFAWVRAAYDRTLAAGEVPLVIDCGANIGLSSLYFAKHLPKARIVGIEPEPENVALARRNTQSHPLIEIVEAAVSDQAGSMHLVNPEAEKYAYQVREAGDRGDRDSPLIEALTIDTIMQRSGARRNLIVKVDIEGGEQALFRSNVGWLDHTDLLIIETHDWLFPGEGTSQPLFAAIAGRKFEVIQKGEYISFFFQ